MEKDIGDPIPFMKKSEISSLIASCDCFVSLHRSEGSGLSLAEAMDAGKPVIATGYSGNLDFMDINNSYLVKSKLISLEKDYGPYTKGSVWAEPDIEHAASLMKLVYENRQLANEIGKRASLGIKNNFSVEKAGKEISDRIRFLEG